MLDELIGPADAHDWRRNALLVEQFKDRASIPPRQHMILQRHDCIGSPSEEFVRALVQRFEEARIDKRDIEPFGGEWLGCLASEFEHVAQAKEGDFAAAVVGKILDDLSLADLQ